MKTNRPSLRGLGNNLQICLLVVPQGEKKKNIQRKRSGQRLKYNEKTENAREKK